MTKEARAYNKVKTVSSINDVGKIGQVHAKNETRPPTTPYRRINSNWIKDLNVSHETIKILEENIGYRISDISCSNIFANISPRSRKTKEKNKQMGLHQTMKFLHSKRNDQQNKKKTHCMGEHTCQWYIW